MVPSLLSSCRNSTIKEVKNPMIRVEDKYWCSERDMLLLQTRVKIVMRQDVNAGKSKNLSGWI